MPTETSASWSAAESELKALWLQAQAGDESAYREALTRIARLVRAYLRRRMAGQDHDVEDLVQESMLAMHLHRGSYDPAQPLTAWACAITRHKLIDFWRRNGRHAALHEPLDDVDDVLVARQPQDSTSHLDLGKLLVELPPAQRTAIELTKLQGLSALEAAEKMGVTEGGVRVLVHRGMKRLSRLVKGGLQ